MSNWARWEIKDIVKRKYKSRVQKSSQVQRSKVKREKSLGLGLCLLYYHNSTIFPPVSYHISTCATPYFHLCHTIFPPVPSTINYTNRSDNSELCSSLLVDLPVWSLYKEVMISFQWQCLIGSSEISSESESQRHGCSNENSSEFAFILFFVQYLIYQFNLYILRSWSLFRDNVGLVLYSSETSSESETRCSSETSSEVAFVLFFRMFIMRTFTVNQLNVIEFWFQSPTHGPRITLEPSQNKSTTVFAWQMSTPV